MTGGGAPGAPGRPVFRVGELISGVRGVLARAFREFWVEGEIDELHRSRPGHIYFDLKDESARLRCVLFRNAAEGLAFELSAGAQVRARARFDLYAERGMLQLVVEELEPAGEGALRLAFERMKRRLHEEGLFDPAGRRPLPEMPTCVGVVTSLQGAAVHDLIRGLRQRRAALELVLFDARVQGDGAWREIVRGLHLLDAHPRVELIVVARGGGSLQDLWNFNREEVVRAVRELSKPVVSAIGHEVDLVLLDLAADARAATPTAAAGLLAPDGALLERRLAEARHRLRARPLAQLREARHRLEALRRGLVHPAQRLRLLRTRLQGGRERLLAAAQGRQGRRRLALEALGARLHALSPLGVLARGYSLAQRGADGAILRSSREVAPGDEIRVRLAEGALRATVLGTVPDVVTKADTP